MNVELLRNEVRRSADEFVLAVYVLAAEIGDGVGSVMEEAVRDARARLIERGMLTDEEES